MTGLDLTYSYNTRGLVSDIIDGVSAENTRVYGYDGQGRLTSASGPWGAIGTFDYDSLGNIRKKVLGTRSVTMSYDARNRLSAANDTGETGNRTVSYDTRGNVTWLGGQNFTYNAMNRPTSMGGDVDAVHRYDGHGRRIRTVTYPDEGGYIIRYNVFGATGDLIFNVQIDQSPTDENYVTTMVKMDGQTIARVKSEGRPWNYTDTVTYLHNDHLGSAGSGTDESGAVAWREEYSPFGMTLINDAANDNQAGFTGHIKDSDTGLNYMQARYYDPVIGRFLSVDPVTFLDKPYPGQFNRYAYTWNDPINATDPNGEFLKIVKSVYNVGKRTYKNGGNLKGALKDEALSYVENGATLLSKDASLGDKAFAIFDLATGFGDEAKGAKRLLGGKCCFVAGTLVETEYGLRPIEEIELGDRVLARNPETGETAFKAVTDLIHLNERMIWEVSLSGENNTSEFFETTDDHPWWIVDTDGNGSWKTTAELSEGMIVTTADNQTMVITKVVQTNRIDATYNLTVADFETYFVGENKVLVHNCPIDAGDVQRIDPGKISTPASKPGNAPIGNDGHPIELHHTDGANGPLKEMTQTEHRRGENFRKNHPVGHPKLTKEERKQFNNDKRQYWKDREPD